MTSNVRSRPDAFGAHALRPREIALTCAAVSIAHALGFALIARTTSSRTYAVPAPPQLVAVDVIDVPQTGAALRLGTASGTGAGTPARRPSHAGHAPPPAKASPTNEPPAIGPSGADPAAPTSTPSAPSTSDTSASSAGAEAPTATGPTATGPSASASSPAHGDVRGSPSGTETDPFRAGAIDAYRHTLDGWFSARFHIRGKVPFADLATLHADVIVSIDAGRRVSGSTLSGASGNAAFDAQLRADLAAIQASGVEIPGPPPDYADILQSTLHLRFSCTTRARCE